MDSAIDAEMATTLIYLIMIFIHVCALFWLFGDFKKEARKNERNA